MERYLFYEEAVWTVARENDAGQRNRGHAMAQDKSFGLEAAFLRTARRSGVQTVTREKGAGDKQQRLRACVAMPAEPSAPLEEKIEKDQERAHA